MLFPSIMDPLLSLGAQSTPFWKKVFVFIDWKIWSNWLVTIPLCVPSLDTLLWGLVKDELYCTSVANKSHVDWTTTKAIRKCIKNALNDVRMHWENLLRAVIQGQVCYIEQQWQSTEIVHVSVTKKQSRASYFLGHEVWINNQNVVCIL